ncbi:MAG: gliding motility-associated C-terminal domain-containing protein [Bacteroidetes bacterium]|nr:gliding motility-associated C-terminal domain-containing protein [Bacteroidota bacterium]
MNLEDKKIQELFSKKLGNMELPVDPQVWAGVQSGIGVGAAGSTATGLGFFAKLALAVASIAVVGTVGFFALNQEEKVLVSETPASQKEMTTKPSEEQGSNSNETDPSLIIEEKAESSASNKKQEDATRQNPMKTGQKESAPELNTVSEDTQNTLNQAITSEGLREEIQDKELESEKELEHSSPISYGTPATSETANQAPLSAEFSAKKDDYNPYDFYFSTKEQGDVNYYWEMGDGTSYSTQTVNHEYMEEGDYIVRLTKSNESGASSSQEMLLEVVEPSELIIPNVFTPNNDGKNAQFDISRASKNIEIITLIIFNDKQEMVFQSDERADSWDGNDQFGNVCPAGTYRYWIKAIGSDGVSYKRGGNVTLLR